MACFPWPRALHISAWQRDFVKFSGVGEKIKSLDISLLWTYESNSFTAKWDVRRVEWCRSSVSVHSRCRVPKEFIWTELIVQKLNTHYFLYYAKWREKSRALCLLWDNRTPHFKISHTDLEIQVSSKVSLYRRAVNTEHWITMTSERSYLCHLKTLDWKLKSVFFFSVCPLHHQK